MEVKSKQEVCLFSFVPFPVDFLATVVNLVNIKLG